MLNVKNVAGIGLASLTLLMTMVVRAQDLDIFGHQVPRWNAGIEGGIPAVVALTNAEDFGLVGDGQTDDSSAIQNALNAAPVFTAVWLPAGTYLLNQPLVMPGNVVLRGAGRNATHLLINHDSHAIDIVNYDRGDWVSVVTDIEKGSNQINVQSVSTLSVGDYLEIEQDNDAAVMYTVPEWNQLWAQGAVGAVNRLVAIDGNVVTLKDPFRIAYSQLLNPKVRRHGFIENVGVENLHIERIDTSDRHIFNIKNAANIWLKDVHSERARKYHVKADTVYRLEVRACYFDDASDWGGGGHGYGVALSRHTSASLVVDNDFRHLRHSMLLQLGANGNVLLGNKSTEPYQNQSGTWTPPDISMHGHFPYSNLIQENDVQEIGIADHWGPVGPDNTYLRNRVRSEDIFAQDNTQSQYIIGNIIDHGDLSIDENSDYPQTIDLSTYIRHGNVINGVVSSPDFPNQAGPSSLLVTPKESVSLEDEFVLPQPIVMPGRPRLLFTPQ